MYPVLGSPGQESPNWDVPHIQESPLKKPRVLPHSRTPPGAVWWLCIPKGARSSLPPCSTPLHDPGGCRTPGIVAELVPTPPCCLSRPCFPGIALKLQCQECWGLCLPQPGQLRPLRATTASQCLLLWRLMEMSWRCRRENPGKQEVALWNFPAAPHEQHPPVGGPRLSVTDPLEGGILHGNCSETGIQTMSLGHCGGKRQEGSPPPGRPGTCPPLPGHWNAFPTEERGMVHAQQ